MSPSTTCITFGTTYMANRRARKHPLSATATVGPLLAIFLVVNSVDAAEFFQPRPKDVVVDRLPGSSASPSSRMRKMATMVFHAVVNRKSPLVVTKPEGNEQWIGRTTSKGTTIVHRENGETRKKSVFRLSPANELTGIIVRENGKKTTYEGSATEIAKYFANADVPVPTRVEPIIHYSPSFPGLVKDLVAAARGGGGRMAVTEFQDAGVVVALQEDTERTVSSDVHRTLLHRGLKNAEPSISAHKLGKFTLTSPNVWTDAVVNDLGHSVLRSVEMYARLVEHRIQEVKEAHGDVQRALQKDAPGFAKLALKTFGVESGTEVSYARSLLEAVWEHNAQATTYMR